MKNYFINDIKTYFRWVVYQIKTLKFMKNKYKR